MEAAVQNVKAVTSQDRVQDKRRQCSARRGGGSKIEQNRSKDESQQIAEWKLQHTKYRLLRAKIEYKISVVNLARAVELALHDNHPDQRMSLNRSQYGSCSTERKGCYEPR